MFQEYIERAKAITVEPGQCVVIDAATGALWIRDLIDVIDEYTDDLGFPSPSTSWPIEKLNDHRWVAIIHATGVALHSLGPAHYDDTEAE